MCAGVAPEHRDYTKAGHRGMFKVHKRNSWSNCSIQPHNSPGYVQKSERYCLDLGRKEKDDSFFSLANDTTLGNYTKQIIHNGRKPVTSSFVPWGGTIIIANHFSLLSATNPSLPPCLRLLPKLRLQERLQIKPVVRGIRNHCKRRKKDHIS